MFFANIGTATISSKCKRVGTTSGTNKTSPKTIQKLMPTGTHITIQLAISGTKIFISFVLFLFQKMCRSKVTLVSALQTIRKHY